MTVPLRIDLMDCFAPKTPRFKARPGQLVRRALRLERIRWYDGKGLQGWIRGYFVDPVFVGLDAWALKWGLSRFNAVPLDELSRWRFVQIDPPAADCALELCPVEELYSLWRNNVLGKRSRVIAKKAMEAHYLPLLRQEDREEILALFDKLFSALITDFQGSSDDGVHGAEVQRQMSRDLYVRSLIARAHCLRQAKERGIKMSDIEAPLADVLRFPLLELIRTVPNWDGVVELIDTPSNISEFLQLVDYAKWTQLDDDHQSTFASLLEEGEGI